MKKIILFFVFVTGAFVSLSQQLNNSNLELWTSQTYGQEPVSWRYNDGTALVFGTNNIIRSYDDIDPITTTKITGANAFGGSGNSVLLETKSALGATMLSNGFSTIPGYLYRQESFTNPNLGSITFKYKSNVVQGDSCFVKVGLLDASYNILSYGIFWIKPQQNTTSWQTKTLLLENQLAGTPSEIFIEAMSTYDENYTYNTPIIGSQLYLDNFVLNYCSTPIVSNVTETICENMLPFTWNDVVFNASGNQSVTLTSAAGCDSLVNMTLNVIGGPFTQVPDQAFEQQLIVLGYDPCGIIDGYVPTNYINTETSLTIVSTSIEDFTGIEDFQSLQALALIGPDLTTVNGFDISSFTELKSFIHQGAINNIDVSQNTNLENLRLLGGDLTTLDLSSNSNLISVSCRNSGIENLVLPNSTTLKYLLCDNNNINFINLSTVPNLEILSAANNLLINLAIAHNSLKTIVISNNYFTGLNLSGYSQLDSLNCSSNQLECLSLNNNNNNNFIHLNTTGNFNLTCIEVDDSTFCTNNPIWNTGIDSWSSFSEDCAGLCFTTEIDEIDDQSIVISPNPASSEINISVSIGLIGGDYEIRDITGKLVLSGYFHDENNLIRTNSLISGVYFISAPSHGIKSKLLIE